MLGSSNVDPGSCRWNIRKPLLIVEFAISFLEVDFTAQ